MTARLLAIAALLLSACGAGPRSAPAPHAPTAVPFEVSSVETHYALRGRFAGRAHLEGDSLVVQLTEGAVHAAGGPSTAYDDVRLTAAVGAATGRGWDVRARSEPRPVRARMTGGDTAPLDTARFVVRGLGGIDPARDWLVFEFAARNARAGGSFTTYACGATSLLPRPGTPDPRAARLRAEYERTC